MIIDKQRDRIRKTPLLMGFMILSILIMGGIFVSALDYGTGKEGENFSILQICDDATYITLSTITLPNKTSPLIINANMTSLGGGAFQYNFSQTNNSGTYDACGISDGCDKTFCRHFIINPAGVESSDSRTAVVGRAVWFLFAISIILFIAFLFVKSKPSVKWTFFLISMMFFLQAISILFTGMQDEVVNPKIEGYFSFLATSSFILFWFAFGILAVLWIITTFQTILFNKAQKKREKYGG